MFRPFACRSAALVALVLSSLTVGAATSAEAQVVIGPVAVSSPQGDFGGSYPLIDIINQSGLSNTYTSGVTDFATFMATTFGFGLSGAGFTGTEANGPQQFTFDLGANYLVNAIGVWQSGSVGWINQFALYADNDADFSNGVGAQLLGATALVENTSVGQTFAFTGTQTRYVHFSGLSSAQDPDFYGLNEVVFGGTQVVPEPASLALLTTGLVALAAAARRRA